MSQFRFRRPLPAFTAVTFSGLLAWTAVAAEPTDPPSLAIQPAVIFASTARAARPAATQSIAPLDVTKLKVAGLLGDPRFRHAGPINSIAVTDGGKQILSCAFDGTARFWDAATGQELRRVQCGDGAQDVNAIVRRAVPLPDGKRMLTFGNFDLTLWNLETGKVVWNIKHTSEIWSMAVSPNGKQAFTGDMKGTIIQWDVEAGHKIREIPGHTGQVSALAITPEGKTLISCAQDKSIRLWNTDDGQVLGTLEGHSQWVLGLALSPDGKRLASVSNDKTLRLWSVPRALQKEEGRSELWKVAPPSGALRVAFSPDGRNLLASTVGHVSLVKGDDGAVMRTIEVPGARCPEIAFGANANEVLISADVVICRWDLVTGKRLYPSADIDEKFAAAGSGQMAFSPDGKRLYGGGGWASINLWNLQLNELEDVWKKQKGFSPLSLQLSSDGKLLLVGGYGQAAIIDTTTGKSQREFNIGQGNNNPWWWSHNDQSIITFVNDTALTVFPVKEGNSHLLAKIFDRNGLPRLLAIDGDRQNIICGIADRVTIWNIDRGVKLADVRTWPVSAAQWLPAEKAGGRRESAQLLTVGYDGTMQCWQPRLAPMAPEPTAETLAQWVRDLASPDSKVADEATARLIEARPLMAVDLALSKADLTNREVENRVAQVRRSWVADRPIGQPLKLGETITTLAVHPDGLHWAAILPRGAASVVVLGEVTPEGPKELRRLSDGQGACGLLFSPDGNTLYMGNGNATISIYRAK